MTRLSKIADRLNNSSYCILVVVLLCNLCTLDIFVIKNHWCHNDWNTNPWMNGFIEGCSERSVVIMQLFYPPLRGINLQTLSHCPHPQRFPSETSIFPIFIILKLLLLTIPKKKRKKNPFGKLRRCDIWGDILYFSGYKSIWFSALLVGNSGGWFLVAKSLLPK